MKISRPQFSQNPLLWLAAAFACGIVCSASAYIPILLSGGVCVLSASAAAMSGDRRLMSCFLLAAFLGLGAFSHQMQVEGISPNRIRAIYDSGEIASGEPVEVEGFIEGGPETAPDGFFLLIDADSLTYRGKTIQAAGRVRLFVPIAAGEDRDPGHTDLSAGSRVRAACALEREDRFRNLGVKSRIEILDQQGIDASANLKSSLLIENAGEGKRTSPLGWIFEQRNHLVNDFREHLGAQAAGIMSASLLGNKYFLDKDTADLFRDGGTFHVLVISGLHITFIGAIVFAMFGMVTKHRAWRFVATAIILWSYTLAVGADVPVVRATLMFTTIAFGRAIWRNGSLSNSLGLCGLILLAWRPDDLFSASFQLTFASVGSIAAAGVPLIEKLRSIGKWMPTAGEPLPPRTPGWLTAACETLYWHDDAWDYERTQQVWTARIFKAPLLKLNSAVKRIASYMIEAILVSTIVQIWLLPFSVVYFHRVSPGGVLLNLWVGLFIALESVFALITVLAGKLSGLLAVPLAGITETLNWLMTWLPKLMIESDLASFRLPAYAGAGKAVYFVYFVPLILLTAGVYFWDPFAYGGKRKQGSIEGHLTSRKLLYAAGTAMALLIAVVVYHPLSGPAADGRLRIDFLDVGQGDSALITFPDGQTLLIDGGGQQVFRNASVEDSAMFQTDAPRIGEAVVSQFLWSRGYGKVDFILATHADADHIQGLTDIARNFDVRAAMFGRMPPGDPDFAELAAVLVRKRVPAVRIARGDIFEIGGVRVQVLFPEADDSNEAASDNDHSVVLRLVYGERTILLTGDVERIAENLLLENGDTLKADVVKVPHHGSRTSSTGEFVDAVNPSYAVISVGRRSRFGHPHPEVVERWKAAGANVLTTGESGTVTFTTDGIDLKMELFAIPK